jgi:curli biogenesis system outer membrane secretion channel CsgG
MTCAARSFLRRALVAVAASALLVPSALAQASRPTVAVVDLEYGTIQQWWGWNWDIGKGIADLIVDGLLEDGSYRVIERKHLDAILAEQNFSNSYRAEPPAEKVAQLGKALGVRYLIFGSVTRFGTEKKDFKVDGAGYGAGRFGLGRVGTSKGKANVALAVRMVDTTTGEILASAKGEGTSSRSGLLLGGSAVGGFGAGGNIDMGSSEYRETVLGEATEQAVKMVVTKLAEAKTRIEAP